MSEFFNVTHDKDIVLDDSVISKKTGWTSEKIVREIIENRITKFEELKDVDVVNKKDKQVVIYSSDTKKFTTVDGIDAGEMMGTGMRQICKMGIEGSPEKPRLINIPINTVDFKVPRVNVLKYDTGDLDIIVTKNEFTNAEANDFKKDNMMVFDGKAHMCTEYVKKCEVIEPLNDEEIEYEVKLNKSDFKNVYKFEIEEDGQINNLKITAIPHDRLLIPKGDMNLSNAKHIDYFKLIGEGANLRIVCSVDSGQTWKTFFAEKWTKVPLTVEDIKEKGLSIEQFNNINDVFWNQLITAHKIRFAYLFCMDNLEDIEEMDKLNLQYDGEGKWLQAKEDTFDVIYASNTILQVLVKFNGDIKINY